MISSSHLVDWLLEGLELDASLFHVGRYCGGWHASTQGMGRASFHLVVQGHCWLHLDGQAEAVRLEAGDAVFLLRDLAYRLSSDQNPVSACTQPRQAMQALDATAGDGVGLVCGFFHFRPGLSSLIVEGLADWILLRANEPAGHAARALFGLILEECERLPPSQTLLERLTHLLFLYVLRQQVHAGQPLGGLVALARQPAFAALLVQLIEQPGQAWTLENMAACTGLSRSAFFKRFNELAGQSPGQVLLALRMRHASQLLQAGNTVEQVGAQVGYQSVAAFTRAFAKAVGVQPGAYRRQHEGR
ncbi:AraC family transcriptional regulator [Pseudomonas kermanshahensis]|uniref:AraC family transcriptional regulator n=1 Tax=Pseudomonas kermanshahensis TaxID=2745482 RepID=A0ABU8RD02_9PSED|nr:MULTISPECIES: AraC family transcriptional regulator [Pseudomonas]MBC3488566.1 AraC family transcriptional regulator [Pseudomonas sp. SWRI50]MBC3498964.1 AraC family transcriptional regulator [Pseudomonas sp. SWRI67]MBV4526384.1 AraC family transcriptional regulator [Pseudomonas kermanshahensis]